MPPLNRKYPVDRVDTIYQVKFQECNTSMNSGKPYTNDTSFVTDLSTAMLIAVGLFDSDPCITKMGTGMIILYEDHDAEEEYDRVTIRDRRVYSER